MRVYRLEHRETGAGIFTASLAPAEWRGMIPGPYNDIPPERRDFVEGKFGFTQRQVRAMFRKSVRILTGECGVNDFRNIDHTREEWRTFAALAVVVTYAVPRSGVVACTRHQVLFRERQSARLDTVPVSHYLPESLLDRDPPIRPARYMECGKSRRNV